MTRKLIIVDNLSLAQKVGSLVGSDYKVLACPGPVRDLSDDRLGVDVKANFCPDWRIVPSATKLIKPLLAAMRSAHEIYLAMGDDLEGEAAAWHLVELAGSSLKNKRVSRVVFNAVSQEAVRAALQAPRPLNLARVDAQQARRVIDRLVGYLITPLVSRQLGNDQVVAGRLAGVCLRLISERNRQRSALEPVPYWTLAGLFETAGATFTAPLFTVAPDGKPTDRLAGMDKAGQIQRLLTNAIFWVDRFDRTKMTRPAVPPFTTAALQQDAHRRFGFSPDYTMTLAGGLYEAGYVTCPYTDGSAVSAEAQTAASVYIALHYGNAALSDLPPRYAGASEAIRPVQVTAELPLDTDAGKLYHLIRARFLASQMRAACYECTAVQVVAGVEQGKPFPGAAFRLTTRRLTSEGWLKVYSDNAEANTAAEALPPLRVGERLNRQEWITQPHTTSVIPHYTAASLIAALEQNSLGQPVSFAAVLRTLQKRGYVREEAGELVLTALGVKLSDLLSGYGDVFEPAYNAALEKQLDQIATGAAQGSAVLAAFWAEHLAPALAVRGQAAAPVKNALRPVITRRVPVAV